MHRLSAKDLVIAALADEQHGVVSRAQLLDAGLSADHVEWRLRSRRLRRLYYGVYAVGHTRLTADGRWMAAVLAGGRGARLSNGSAAAAWELRRTSSGLIHVTVPTNSGRERRAGLRIHRSALAPRDVAEIRGIPVTSVARTIIDLSRTLKGRPLEALIDAADQRGLVDFDHLRSANSAALKAVLRTYAPAPTRSELEERFLQLCDDHGIPRPETNARVEGMEVDFVWRDRRLIVEVDGYAYHRAPSRFEADRERDVMLGLSGWRVLRFTWRHVTERAAWVAAAVTQGRGISSRPWP
jgi:predicted transcriptional regulator of viral defense system